MDSYYSKKQISILFVSWLRSIHQMEDEEIVFDDESLDSLTESLAEFAENSNPTDVVSMITMSLYACHVFSTRLGLSTEQIDDGILTPVLIGFFENDDD